MPVDDKILKVISYNIHKGFSARNRKFVLPEMRVQLQKVDANLLFLQEVQGKQREKRLQKANIMPSAQPEYLAEDHWPFYIYGKNAVYDTAHHGNAILSHYPFKQWHNLILTKQLRASRSLLHGIMAWQDVALHAVCIHLGLLRSAREKQLLVIEKYLLDEIPANAPLIVAGDFNDWRQNALDQLKQSCTLKEVFAELYGDHAKTFPARRPRLAFDRIYYRNLKLINAAILIGEPWSQLSDHLPLCAEFSGE